MCPFRALKYNVTELAAALFALVLEAVKSLVFARLRLA